MLSKISLIYPSIGISEKNQSDQSADIKHVSPFQMDLQDNLNANLTVTR